MSDRASTAPGTRAHAPAPDADRDPSQPLEPDASLGDLLAQLTRDFGDLVSTQVDLAKVELKDEIKQTSKGAGLLGGGAFGAYLAVLLLSFAAVYGLDEAMPLGVAFLIVGLVYAAVSVVLIRQGRNKLRSVDSVPETQESLKEDLAWAKQQKS